ncbi:unnamed protein product [Amoebophrya sp. A25]|nr:unnamed protein product [Amoebophrya sp. A25]|eukprot:GSA25T00013220001.1
MLSVELQPLSADSPVAGSTEKASSSTKPVYQAFRETCVDHPVLASFLIFVPLGITSHALKCSDPTIFTLNFLGIVPLAWLIGKTTEDLACHTNQVLGGLINATFGNVVEMLLCCWGIIYGQITVVQATLVGSILSNLLLVMGTSFLYGGFYHQRQVFNQEGAKVQSSLLLLALLTLVLPTMFSELETKNDTSMQEVLLMSRMGSFFLLVVYAQYLYFQISTHADLFQDEEEQDEEPSFFFSGAMLVLSVATVLTAIMSEYLIQSIEATVLNFGTSKEFIGIIVLPIIGNAAEHYTAIIMAGRNKMDLSLGVAVGSGCQMMLLVTPITVLMGWYADEPMSLNFHPFQIAVLLVSVLIVNRILANGETNWLEGVMLVNAYVFIAMMYFLQTEAQADRRKESAKKESAVHNIFRSGRIYFFTPNDIFVIFTPY